MHVFISILIGNEYEKMDITYADELIELLCIEPFDKKSFLKRNLKHSLKDSIENL